MAFHLCFTTVLWTGSGLSWFYKWGSCGQRGEAALLGGQPPSEGQSPDKVEGLTATLCLPLHLARIGVHRTSVSPRVPRSQRPNLTHLYLKGWLARDRHSVDTEWLCCQIQRIHYNLSSHPSDCPWPRLNLFGNFFASECINLYLDLNNIARICHVRQCDQRALVADVYGKSKMHSIRNYWYVFSLT